MAAQQEVVPAKGMQVAVYPVELLQKVREQDPDKVLARMAARYAQAKTLDDLFEVMEGTLTKNIIGKTIRVVGVEWAPYDKEGKEGVLAVLQCADASTGEISEVATTAFQPLMFTYYAELLGQLPFEVRVTESKTRSGQTAINFERP